MCYACGFMWSPFVGCLPQLPSILLFETESLTEVGSHLLAKLAEQFVVSSALVLLPWALCAKAPAF